MPIMTNDDGALEILEAYFKGRNLELRLFTNDMIPADDDVVGDYVEAAGGGYSAKPLTGANWTGAVVGGIAQVAYADQVYEFTDPLTGPAAVYGYAVVNPATGKVVYAERGAAPYTPVAGGVYLVKPVYKLSKGTPT